MIKPTLACQDLCVKLSDKFSPMVLHRKNTLHTYFNEKYSLENAGQHYLQ